MLLTGLGTAPARALLPISHYHDLVAGEGAQGYRDGAFFSALFNFPQGLAVDPQGRFLYVADRDNNCIRVIDLDKANQVKTLAGSPTAGFADGPFSRASFNHPTALAFLPGNRLAIFDSGNQRLRLADLSRKTLSTLAGNGSEGFGDGKALQTPVSGVWNLVYDLADGALYFTQPEDGALRKLDLLHRRITSAFRQNPRIPKPQALCLFQGHVCVAGDGLKAPVCLMERDTEGRVNLRPIGTGSHVLALGSSQGSLYAVQAGSLAPWARVFPPPPLGGDSLLKSVWGGGLGYAPNESDPFLWPDQSDQAGLVADPRQPGRFFVSSGYLQSVVGVKDYSFAELIRGNTVNREGLHDFEYPLSKPPHTFRLLVVGNSYPFHQSTQDDRRWGWPGGGGFGNRMESMPKRLELFLNTQAALRDVPWHYEVLTLSAPGPSFVWLRYQAPAVIREYGVDLVLYFVESSSKEINRTFKLYFERPLTTEGIPQAQEDPEYPLKPCEEKVPGGLPGDFYRHVSTKGWASPLPNHQFAFADAVTLLGDPVTKAQVEAMAGKPLERFQEELKKIQAQDRRPVGFEVCFLPMRDADNSRFHLNHLEELRHFWEDTSRRIHAPFLDLTAPMVALEKTFWPVDESGGGQHFDANGHLWFAYLLAQELIDQRLIPFTPIQEKAGEETSPDKLKN